MGLRFKRILVALAAALLVLSGLGAQMASADAGLEPVKVDPATVAQGGELAVSGTGCRHDNGAQVTVKVGDLAPVAVTPAEEDGSWSLKAAIPADFKTGETEVRATCDGYDEAIDYPLAKVTVKAKEAGEPTAKVELSSPSAKAGGSVTATGSGFAPGEKVTATLLSDPVILGEFVADTAGNVKAVVKIPESTPVGAHRIELRGVTSKTVASTPITIAAAEGSSGTGPASPTAPGGTPIGAGAGSGSGTGSGGGSGSSLAFTGASSLLLAGLGLATLAAGAAIVLAQRRRVA